jgi:hypothetical protein
VNVLDVKRAWIGLCAAAVVIAGCAPAINPPAQSAERAQNPPPRSKMITIGIQHGFLDFSPFSAQATGGSAANIPPMVNDGLSYTDERIVSHPLKAAELPSILGHAVHAEGQGSKGPQVLAHEHLVLLRLGPGVGRIT